MAHLPQRKLAVIMFMDIVGYTSMVQESEQKALEFVRIHNQSIEEFAPKYNGKVINYYGDASMSMFDSAVDAVLCATELQKAYHNKHDLPMRVGLHLGEVVMDNDTIYGNGVNIASRLESLGIPGSVLISGSINTELENQDQIQTTLLGNYQFKNVAEPIKVYAISDDQLVMPKPKELRSEKGAIVKSKRNLVGAALLFISALICIFFYSKFLNKSDVNDLTVLQEKIVVPPFKNYSGNKENDFIGEMVAHRITKELFEIEGADVIDFQTNDQIAQVKYMSFGSSVEGFTKQSGAVNILEGNFYKNGEDSLMFSATIKRLSDNVIVRTFPEVTFIESDPIKGISNLTSYINGYWKSKNENLLSFPKLEAYKLYLKAKSSWYTDDNLTESYLLNAIEIDPHFYDVYDLLLAHYYNIGEGEKAKAIVAQLTDKFVDMSQREQNVIHQMTAVFNGDNKNVFKYAKILYLENPKDLFMNTGFMACSNDFMHDYKETITAFKEIDINELNIKECRYCEDRLGIAISAYLGGGNFDEVKSLIKLFPAVPNISRTHSIRLRYYSMTNQLDKINELIQEASEGKLIRDASGKFIKNAITIQYIAARELYVEGQQSEASVIAKSLVTDVKAKGRIKSWGYYFINDLEKAEKGFKSHFESTGDVRDLSQLGVIAAKMGDKEKAWEYIADIESFGDIDFGGIEYNQARIYLHLAEKEKALELLDAAVQDGARFYSFNVFENDPDLISLRDDIEFNRIIFPMDQ